MRFGEVIDSDIRLNEKGMIVQQTWDDLPRHYHCIDLDAFIVASFVTRQRWIAFALTSQIILRGGRKTRRISRE